MNNTIRFMTWWKMTLKDWWKLIRIYKKIDTMRKTGWTAKFHQYMIANKLDTIIIMI